VNEKWKREINSHDHEKETLLGRQQTRSNPVSSFYFGLKIVVLTIITYNNDHN
jgi:hypothetical protein